MPGDRRVRALLATMPFLVVACGHACGGAVEETLTVADVRQGSTSLVFVAEDLGCFARQKLRIEEHTFDLGRDALVALAEGRAEVAIAYETPTLRSFFADPTLRVLSTLHTSTRNTRVVARRARVREPADLRGARVGVAAGTNAEYFLATLLTFGGIGRAEVKVVNLAPERSAAALAAGEVDAAALFDAYAAQARATLGDEAVELSGGLYTEYSLVTARAEVVGRRREALKRFLRGLLCAEEAVRQGAPVAFDAVRKRLPDRTDAELRDALGRVKRTVTVDGLLLSVLRGESSWLWAATGSPAAAPDVAQLVDATLLDEVDPEAVNIALPPRP